MLTGKKIVLGVTGGIAVYKAVDLVSKLTQAGAQVRVVMSEAATKLVTPLTFKEISGHGKVVFQAYDADNQVLKMAAIQDYAGFAQVELQARKELWYPPYSNLLKITVLHKDQNLGNAIAEKIVDFLETQKLDKNGKETQVMGPFPAIVAMVNNIYRVNVLIKSNNMIMVIVYVFHLR